MGLPMQVATRAAGHALKSATVPLTPQFVLLSAAPTLVPPTR